jgi:oxygen-independent coproporphyrinogen-3 oxidase
MTSLYLHIPFCVRKCPYCDFFSTDRHTPADLDEYVGLLIRHLDLAAAGGSWRGPLTTVFFGGGTPSLLAPSQIGRILEHAARCFDLAPDAEISLEANPGTVTADSMAGYRAAGANRLSLGVQSLDAGNLRRLGRIHSPEDALAAIRQARQAGFANLSCDLIFAQPGQTPALLGAELDQLLAEAPEHLSCYGLSVEEGTPYQRRQADSELCLPDENVYAEQFLALHRRLAEAGFAHYEISNYARPGYRCRHNLGYWRRQPALGVGVGAHSFHPEGWGRRLAVPPDLAAYRRRLDEELDPAGELECFDRRGAMAETLYLGLRTAEGVDETAFAERFGAPLAEVFGPASRQASDYLRKTGGRWRLSPEGWLIFDHLILPFL